MIIEVRLRDGWGPRAIGLSLLRSGGTIFAEINRHGGARLYREQLAADQAATDRSRSRPCHDGGLFSELCRLLRLGWSPEQIAVKHATNANSDPKLVFFGTLRTT